MSHMKVEGLLHHTGAFVDIEGQKYWRDGVLYGRRLGEESTIMQGELFEDMVLDYTSKPSHVQAGQLTQGNVEKLAKWSGAHIVEEIDPVASDQRSYALNVPAIPEPFRVSMGDYLIRTEHGNFMKLTKQEFLETFEMR